MLVHVVLRVRQEVELVVLVEQLRQGVAVTGDVSSGPRAVDQSPRAVHEDGGPGVAECVALHAHARLVARALGVAQDDFTV